MPKKSSPSSEPKRENAFAAPKKPRKPRQKSANPAFRSESSISAEIADYLTFLQAKQPLWHTRIQCGRVRVGQCYVHLSPKGTPDRLVLTKGQAIFFEVKRPGEYPTPDQLKTHDQLRACGAIVHVVRSVAEVGNIMNNIFNELEKIRAA